MSVRRTIGLVSLSGLLFLSGCGGADEIQTVAGGTGDGAAVERVDESGSLSDQTEKTAVDDKTTTDFSVTSESSLETYGLDRSEIACFEEHAEISKSAKADGNARAAYRVMDECLSSTSSRAVMRGVLSEAMGATGDPALLDCLSRIAWVELEKAGGWVAYAEPGAGRLERRIARSTDSLCWDRIVSER